MGNRSTSLTPRSAERYYLTVPFCYLINFNFKFNVLVSLSSSHSELLLLKVPPHVHCYKGVPSIFDIHANDFPHKNGRRPGRFIRRCVQHELSEAEIHFQLTLLRLPSRLKSRSNSFRGSAAGLESCFGG
jgi:hypothetical protein